MTTKTNLEFSKSYEKRQDLPVGDSGVYAV